MQNHRLLKTLSYRIGGTIITMGIVYLFTREWTVATGAGLLDQVLSSIWYYYHDKWWERIQWIGKRET